MKLKNATLKELNITWYLARKPYRKHSSYDLFYLNICREIFEILQRTAAATPSLTGDPDRTELAELAYIATAYFEDKVTGTGFWDACSTLCKEITGKMYPFYPEESYEAAAEGDINAFDLHLLFFLTRVNYFNQLVEAPTVLPCFDPFLLTAAEVIFDHLDSIEEIEESDFYTHWRDVRGDNYLALKGKITWFAEHGYVFANYLSDRLKADIKELADSSFRADTNMEIVSRITYQQRDNRAFQTPSSLLALYPVDIVSRVFTATDRQREQLLRMKNRPTGNFRVSEKDKDHYLFTHTITGDEFTVSISGIERRLPLHEVSLYQTTLAEWGDTWHVSGLCISVLSEAHREKTDQEQQPRFCAYSAPHRAHVEELANKYHETELEYFGHPLTDFPDMNALEEALNGFQAFYAAKIREEQAPEEREDLPPLRVDFGNTLPRSQPVALFLPPGDNEEITLAHERLSRTLQTEDVKKLKPADILFAGECFADDTLSVPYWRYLRETYGAHALSAVLMAPCADDRDFEALLRVYRCYEFSASRLPRMTVVGE